MNGKKIEIKPANNVKHMEYTEVTSITFFHHNEQNDFEPDELEIRGLSHQLLSGLLQGGLIHEENPVTLKIQHLLWEGACVTKRTETISGLLYMVGGKFIIQGEANEYTLYPRPDNAFLASD
jgi:hypothetical protein